MSEYGVLPNLTSYKQSFIGIMDTLPSYLKPLTLKDTSWSVMVGCVIPQLATIAGWEMNSESKSLREWFILYILLLRCKITK